MTASTLARDTGSGCDFGMIMDVGMHLGKDTRFYLEKGFRVVAVEARPDFVERAKNIFKDYIREGRLEIVHCAIAEREGSMPFYVFPQKGDWGTVNEGYAKRNIHRGAEHYVIDVPAAPFESILQRFGVPYYLKVDIEGADSLCLRGLHESAVRPKYISMEMTTTSFDESFEVLAGLYALGYRRFKIVNQRMNELRRCPNPAREGLYVDARFSSETSGPFGEEALGDWIDAERTVKRIRPLLKIESLFSQEGRLGRFRRAYDGVCRRVGREIPGWYDLHATR